MENETVVEARGLSRYYGPVIALESIDFQLQSGELLLVLGANGAGKSTLLAILAGLLQPSRGELRLLGTPLKRRTKEQRGAVGFAGDQPLLYADLTIEESLELVCRASSRRGEMSGRVERAISEFRLADVRRRPLRECSQGIRRRAGLARAFLNEPKLLVLDEPLANLDWTGQEELIALLRRERERGAAAVVAAHEDLLLREENARILFLDGGRQHKGIARIEDFASFKERRR